MSIAPCDYTDFYASVDVTNWDMSVVQAFGLVARICAHAKRAKHGDQSQYEK
jgi:hypothetical protein